MDPAAQFKKLQETLQAALVSTTRTATAINAGDIPFQRSLDPDLAEALDEQNARLLRLVERMVDAATVSESAPRPKLPDADSIDGNWKEVVEVLDSLLEKADTSLDEFTGTVKRLSPADETLATPTQRLVLPTNLSKPQLLFEHRPQNNETGGFKPLLQSKPHAQVPLEQSLQPFVDRSGHEQ